jgi:hypothetical protein
VKGAELLKELDECCAAPQEDVLPIVHLDAALRVTEGRGTPSQEGKLLHQRDGVSVVHETTGGGDAGQAAPYDYD